MNGVIPVLKPAGMSSSNVVGYIRRLLNQKKAGHCGTLDPGAAGVLCVCVGQATKISDYLMDSRKEYIAEFLFGKETDTLDSYGTVVSECKNADIAKQALLQAMQEMVGTSMQIPPMYSAKKIAGQTMYKLARQGIKLDLPAREISIHTMELLDFKHNRALMRIACSKGTYVRSIARDLARKLDTCATMTFLLRSYACGSSVDEAYTLEELSELCAKEDFSFLKPIAAALDNMPQFVLDDYLFPIITTGGTIDLGKIRNANALQGECEHLIFCRNALIGIAKPAGGLLKLRTFLYQKDCEL